MEKNLLGRNYFAALLSFVLLQITADWVHAAEDEITASKIMERMLVKYEKLKDKRPKYTSKTRVTVENLDSEGKVEEIEKMLFHTVIIEGEEYWRLMEKEGKPLTEDDKEKEREREERFRKRLKDRRDGKEEDSMSLGFDRETVGRFSFVLVGTETINGRPTYHLTFSPDTSKELKEKKDIDRFLNACEGELFVDVADLEMVRVKMRLTKTVRFGLGLLAYFKKAALSFEQKKQASGEWLPVSARVYMWGRSLLLKPIRERQKLKFYDYEKQP